jgi:hypothetical protein
MNVRETAKRMPQTRNADGDPAHPPVLAWFNPDAEGETLAAMNGEARNPNARVTAMEEDLEILAMSWCGPADIALLRHPPGPEHLSRLRRAGWDLPEIAGLPEIGGLAHRPLGGFRPWAWSPESSELLRPLAGAAAPASRHPWREALPARWFSKELGLLLESLLGATPGGTLCKNRESALAALHDGLARGPVLLKAPIACAGRGHRRIDPPSPTSADLAWLDSALALHGGVVAEPWLDPVADFSAQYDAAPGGAVRLLGITVMRNDAAGRFRAIRFAREWEALLPPDAARFLAAETSARTLFSERIPPLLAKLLPGYTGPVGIDAMVHRQADGSLALRPVVEVNVRTTMGRVAIELSRRLGAPDPARLQILRKSDWNKPRSPSALLPLNDPATARQFVAVWG